jgi:DNA-binding transcriptional LysR family regulator
MRKNSSIAVFRINAMHICMDWRAIKFDWNQAKAFLVTAEEGSFSSAARALGLSQPTVGRQVAAFEAALGVTLFERVGTQLEITSAGLDLLEYVRAMGAAANSVSLAATGQAESIEGNVSITASEAVSAYLLPRALEEIRAQYPHIELELVVSNAPRDLQRREADIAVRNFQTSQPDLIARKIRDAEARLYASKRYLDARPPITELADIAHADIFAFDRSDLMIAGLQKLGLDVRREQFPISAQSHLVQWEMCKQGLGICIMMAEVGEAEPAVITVLPEISIPIPIWLVCHRELRTSRRIRVVFDILADFLSSH